MTTSVLPDYLCMKTDAAPRADAVVVCGDVRITVITPQLVRIERGAWTDEATQTVICRGFCPCKIEIQRGERETGIDTGKLIVRCAHGLPLETGLTVERREAPAFLWHYGDAPKENLPGTTSTLDDVDGACPLSPSVCSRDGFAVMDDSASVILKKDGWFAPRESCTDVYFFGYGSDYTACVQDYCRLTGAPGMLPAYALGNWWSRYHAYTQEEYLSLMDEFDAQDVPLSVGIVDMDWHLTDGDGRHYSKDGWTGYTWNKALFPDYRAFIAALHERGLRTALNLHPALGVRPWDDQYEAMCRALGKDPAEKKPVPFNCLSPQWLRAYFELLHFPYEDDGVDFWWMDWQQGTDYKKIAGEDYRETGLDAITPLWMLNHMHYLAAARGGQRPMIFSRYAGPGSQRFPIGFSGDTWITWDSLRFQPYFTASASNVGYGWWSHDIGGHMHGTRDDELTVRWIQLGVFSPVFRLHSTSSPFLGREPWNYNKRAEVIISDFMRLRHRLFPYLYTMNRRASEELIPLVRPMYHVHPQCEAAYGVPNEYWFGSELIAAPITDPADSSDLGRVRVWLPDGLFVDAMNGWVYDGGREIDMLRPQEQMPLLMKAGAIVPMQAHCPHSRSLGAGEEMEALVAAGASGAFTLYEDDGETMAYTRGAYAETTLSLDWTDSKAVFTVAPTRGDASFMRRRNWRIILRGFEAGCVFEAAGRPIKAAYDAKTHAYSVTLRDVAPECGAALTVTHPASLISAGGDCRARLIDRIARAQIAQADKHRLMPLIDAALAAAAKGESIDAMDLGEAIAPSLAAHARELIGARK